MREYLFRGKRTDGLGWEYGMLCFIENGQPFIRYWGHGPNGGSSFNVCEVDPNTVGQYTGIKDKYGRKIYEGDVLSVRTSRAHEVKYADGSFFMEGTAIPIRCTKMAQVIGNIHDNPELVEVKA